MKGYDIYKRVINLLGYLNNDDKLLKDDLFLQRVIHIINQILVDLKEDSISSLNSDLNISNVKFDAAIYGVAMLLALSENDAGKNKIFADIYNAKRGSALCQTETVSDKLPYVSYGDD